EERRADKSSRLITVKCLCINSNRKERLRDAVLSSAALEARNRTAGSALGLYFRLAEAEATADLLREGRAELGRLLDRIEKRRADKLVLPPESDLEPLRRSYFDQPGEGLTLRLGIEQINSGLKPLIGLAEDCDLWPLGDFAVRGDPIDCEEAIAVGLENRAELRLLRVLYDELDLETLAEARRILQSVNGLLGGVKKNCLPCLRQWFACLAAKLHVAGGEVESRRAQVGEYLRERERAVADDVRLAVITMETRARLVALARKRIELREARVRELEQREK